MTTCAGCDRIWTGLAECHCTVCHRHFSGIFGFDAHRRGSLNKRYCADPARLRNEAGKPILVPDTRASGIVWVRYREK